MTPHSGRALLASRRGGFSIIHRFHHDFVLVKLIFRYLGVLVTGAPVVWGGGEVNAEDGADGGSEVEPVSRVRDAEVMRAARQSAEAVGQGGLNLFA